MKKGINQNKLLLDYMRNHEHISAAVAMRELGVARLASRIHELRSSGGSCDARKEERCGLME